jgi:hypothetical protein
MVAASGVIAPLNQCPAGAIVKTSSSQEWRNAISGVRKRQVERLEKYLTVPALITAAVLAIVGVFWVRKPYMVGTISCNFLSIGFQASGVFSGG